MSIFGYQSLYLMPMKSYTVAKTNDLHKEIRPISIPAKETSLLSMKQLRNCDPFV